MANIDFWIILTILIELLIGRQQTNQKANICFIKEQLPMLSQKQSPSNSVSAKSLHIEKY